MGHGIVMVGSALDVRGGVSAMARVCAEQGLFERWDAAYLATHCDGSAARKLARALRAWLAFMARLATGRVGLLHVHLNSGASFWRKAMFVLPARALGVPYVLQVHCGRFPDFIARSPAPVRALALGLFRDAAAVVALSPGSAAALAGIAPGVPVQVIPNPVALPAWRASLAAGPPTVLFLGMLTEAKGVFDLLAAWPAVLRARPDARLVLAGAGDGARVRAAAEALGIARSVELPGWVGGEEKEALLRSAWAVTLPSHAEAMPMSVLESMAAGLPVVATRVGGVPSAVEEGVSGLLVAPRDRQGLGQALAAVLQDARLRRSLGQAARTRAATEFSAGVVIPRIEALWRRLAPGHERAFHVPAPTAVRKDYERASPGPMPGQVSERS